MVPTIAIIGAGGKMGSRCTDNLIGEEYKLLLCEKGEAGLKKMRQQGRKALPTEEAVLAADIVIMAVPDVLLGSITEKTVPLLRPNTTVILLDPAAVYAGDISLREDVSYVVTHPCHPSLFRQQETPEARKDLFGGIAAVQDIVIALVQGREEDFALAREVCRKMFAPVDQCHRITLEQMAILEPTLAEVIGATMATVLREAVEVAVGCGVPRKAAEAFIQGHIHTELAISLGVIDAEFSDACKVAVSLGKDWIFKSDWKKVFQPKMVREAVDLMLHPEETKR